MEIKQFNNEREAIIFRDSKRGEGLAASLFTYGKDRYRVKVMEPSNPTHPEYTHRWLSSQAWDLSKDIEDLTKVKEIISSQEFIDCDYESIVFVAKYLNKEHWFNSPKDVIEFFDFPDKQLDKIKDMVDEILAEYEDDWNEYEVQICKT